MTNADVIPHEIVHHSFEVVRSMGGAKAKALFKRAEQLFRRDAEKELVSEGTLKPGERATQLQVEEFAIHQMQETLTKRITDASLISKDNPNCLLKLKAA